MRCYYYLIYHWGILEYCKLFFLIVKIPQIWSHGVVGKSRGQICPEGQKPIRLSIVLLCVTCVFPSEDKIVQSEQL